MDYHMKYRTLEDKKASPSLSLKKFRRTCLKSNNVMFLLMSLFLVLYLREHSLLTAVERGTPEETREEVAVEHRRVMASRRERLRAACSKYSGGQRSEYGSVYQRSEPVNKCTGTYFHVERRDYYLCNVLKGGSTSWRFFFGENNITSTFIADCRPNGNCPKEPELRLVQVGRTLSLLDLLDLLLQVRHPLERLLATWRHVFKNGGWKSLDGSTGQARKALETGFAKFSWNYFVEEVVLQDRFFNRTEEEMDNFELAGSWVKHHWAPYWSVSSGA